MVRFLPEAYEDLAKLDAAHTAFGGKPPYPSDAILNKIELLDTFPLMGPIHPDPFLAQRGFRKISADRWVATYRVDDDIPTIYRVFHQRSAQQNGTIG